MAHPSSFSNSFARRLAAKIKVPTKGLEPTNPPCLFAVTQQASMVQRRVPWTVVFVGEIRHRIRRWKGRMAAEWTEVVVAR
ncbi:hypothetical protein E2562_017708 [Oryza meyeriana var. granulata]|uniref:Uncharacterized protein n=1 Tax=Oryza meyeriana var. granulata TaxID=110450 RepID=A0A6G1BWN8_9ORYZ|nr:hypothetical protein E2562_017708 [Oryza meyeriana var. granulata]